MFSSEITGKAHEVLKTLRKREYRLATAESCTGGLLSAALTEIPNSSEVFERGYVTYSNESKVELLTVPTYYIEDFGAVSFQTAIAMAEGALLMSRADISVSITGVAGPDGGTRRTPVGTVYIATAYQGHETVYELHSFSGSRNSIREKAVFTALEMILKRID
ncbi:MAG: CinA family protein [Rickettsiales bacterium]|nr:CinA family protein [Pseudomonadota bacterium]MDG4542888.1 CinA family protein [Rickettsiales bacterium]MDG4544664.1 CinA family protein [Rickettsiales bacterium]